MASGSTHVAGGDSSESHDTDHQVDDEPLDEMDSPPAVSRCVLPFIFTKDWLPAVNKYEVFGCTVDIRNDHLDTVAFHKLNSLLQVTSSIRTISTKSNSCN
jgi:hypothetical protein